MPNEEAFASVIAIELAHIAMGHHIDTRYAFNDRLMFPDEATFQRIDMYHGDHDNAEAAKKAMEYLQNIDVQGSAAGCRPLLRAARGALEGAASSSTRPSWATRC